MGGSFDSHALYLFSETVRMRHTTCPRSRLPNTPSPSRFRFCIPNGPLSASVCVQIQPAILPTSPVSPPPHNLNPQFIYLPAGRVPRHVLTCKRPRKYTRETIHACASRAGRTCSFQPFDTSWASRGGSGCPTGTMSLFALHGCNLPYAPPSQSTSDASASDLDSPVFDPPPPGPLSRRRGRCPCRRSPVGLRVAYIALTTASNFMLVASDTTDDAMTRRSDIDGPL
ncbi:hypothetical protein B0H15DRAFT_441711 [Mycena belliarum]|uniref:Uncharacterized protein n=1 Tax=Mycena belliarum TaxID=1033014 RepID=A0AAD6XN04_9AGAR|nr:hypothetical protein B0H15DRAFT_441711 [Mycena belliae]